MPGDRLDNLIPGAGGDLVQHVGDARPAGNHLAAAVGIEPWDCCGSGHAGIVEEAAEEDFLDSLRFEAKLAGEENADIGNALGVTRTAAFSEIEGAAQGGKHCAAAEARETAETRIVVQRWVEEVCFDRLDLRP